MSVIIGVGGGTNSGKTTLCRKISDYFANEVFVFNQDAYFKTVQEAKPSFPDSEINWEKCEALKMDKLFRDVITEKDEGTYKIIIVEGHLVLNHPPLFELFDARVFITINHDLAYKRRLTRTYDPPDGIGYFENVVWPGYLSILDEVRNLSHLEKETLFLEAENPDSCLSAVLDLVRSYLQSAI